MKKLFTLMTALCILAMALASSAMAATVLQDEQPPKLLNDDNTLVLVDIHNRAVVESEQVKARLNGAYANVLDAVYHSVLQDSGEMDPHDLVLFELFDVDFTAEEAGSGKELTLEEQTNSPAVALFSADGANWEVLDMLVNGNAITVQVPAPGTVALLCNAQIVQNQEGTNELTEQEIDEDANNFTPSVTGKVSPDIVTGVTADGEIIAGNICNANGEVLATIPDRNYVLVSSYAQRNYVLDIMTHEYLVVAYEDILNADNVGALKSEDEGTIALALDAYLQGTGSDLTADMLVVKDLFEVSVYGDYLHYICDENSYVVLTFDAGLAADQLAAVIHSEDSENWHVHDNFTVNADGTVTMKLHNLGLVAFLVEGEFSVDIQDAVQAP